ncbi:MAG: cysteine desulfurase [Candidatus Omnitrophica bacterium]|nr:cysteine desulfurase [Candidatus Omnitrophota bacterium]
MEAYLDYNSTTPVDARVFEAMKPFFFEQFGNASSFHQKGQATRHAIDQSRERLADFLDVEPGDIVFTSGGTEADNLALKGAMEERAPGRDHLVVSAIEHQAILHAAQYLSKKGVKVTVVPVDAQGIVRADELEKAITDRTALVSIMHANNEVGTIQPIGEIAALAHRHGAWFHTDAVQSFGKIPIDIEGMGIDLLSVSAHKIYGPKGIGALYVRKGVKLKAVTHGGHQEKNMRPGTENVAGIVGFGKAVELVAAEYAGDMKRVGVLRDKLENGFKSAVGNVQVNGDPQRRVANTLNMSFEGLDGETLLMNLDLKKIYVSTGSACTAGSVEPSHVLIAMGLPEKLARAAIRFSLGRFTTEEEIDFVLKEIPGIVERLRKASTENKHEIRSTKHETNSKLK